MFYFIGKFRKVCLLDGRTHTVGEGRAMKGGEIVETKREMACYLGMGSGARFLCSGASGKSQ